MLLIIGRCKIEARIHLSLMQKEVDGHTDADQDDEAAHDAGVEPTSEGGSGEATHYCACNHDDGLQPDHRTGDDKSDYSDTVDNGLQHGSDGIHFAYIFHAHESQRCQHEDANTPTKVSS